eukprot:365747-Chlamydomonas_euryale.AAC.5
MRRCLGLQLHTPTPCASTDKVDMKRWHLTRLQLMTFAYLLPVLAASVLQDRGVGKRSGPEAIIAAPSRELCMQILSNARSLLPPGAASHVQQAIGGANPKRQAAVLRKDRPKIVVGTPARLVQLISRAQLDVSGVRMLVLDEVLVSAMLDASLLQKLGKWVDRALLVSAPPHDMHMSSRSVSRLDQSRAAQEDPPAGVDHALHLVDTKMNTSAALPNGLRHLYCELPTHGVQAVPHVVRLLRASSRAALVFADTSSSARAVWHAIVHQGMQVCLDSEKEYQAATLLTSKLTKLERANVLAAFRAGVFSVLVASDIAAHGLDVPGVDAVINMSPPRDITSYVHRPDAWPLYAITHQFARIRLQELTVKCMTLKGWADTAAWWVCWRGHYNCQAT